MKITDLQKAQEIASKISTLDTQMNEYKWSLIENEHGNLIFDTPDATVKSIAFPYSEDLQQRIYKDASEYLEKLKTQLKELGIEL